jgi:hypothetical protein
MSVAHNIRNDTQRSDDSMNGKKNFKIHPHIKPAKFYKYKNVKREFLCALCESPRALRYSPQLGTNHYQQITVLNLALAYPLYSLMGIKAIFFPFIIWAIFEFTNKILYRHDLICPHCGFDPTWYRRDIKIARRKVEQCIKNKGLEPGKIMTNAELSPMTQSDATQGV